MSDQQISISEWTYELYQKYFKSEPISLIKQYCKLCQKQFKSDKQSITICQDCTHKCGLCAKYFVTDCTPKFELTTLKSSVRCECGEIYCPNCKIVAQSRRKYGYRCVKCFVIGDRLPMCTSRECFQLVHSKIRKKYKRYNHNLLLMYLSENVFSELRNYNFQNLYNIIINYI